MNTSRLLALALVLNGSALVTGCATASEAPVEGDASTTHDAAPVSVVYDAYVAPVDAGAKVDGNAGVCVSTCTSDLDCQNSCATPSEGVNCCDTATQVCYPYQSGSVCPSSLDEADADLPD